MGQKTCPGLRIWAKLAHFSFTIGTANPLQKHIAIEIYYRIYLNTNTKWESTNPVLQRTRGEEIETQAKKKQRVDHLQKTKRSGAARKTQDGKEVRVWCEAHEKTKTKPWRTALQNPTCDNKQTTYQNVKVSIDFLKEKTFSTIHQWSIF